MSGHKVLVVAAHSDDEVLGCGGTMARHSLQGDEVHVLFMTDGVGARGSGNEEATARARASHDALTILGAAGHENLDFPDNRMDSVPLIDVTKAIEAQLARLRPQIVYTHHSGDLNIDHRITHEAVLTALRPQPGSFGVETILAFEVMSSTEWRTPLPAHAFLPNWYTDVTGTLADKCRALECYSAEMRDWPHSRSIEAVRALAQYRGATVGKEAAEGFMLVRSLR